MKQYRDDGRFREWYATPSGQESMKKAREKRVEKIHIISSTEWKNCKTYFENSCAYCGLPIEKHFIKYKDTLRHQDLHRDHADDEGSNGLDNCIPACESCNCSKHSSTFEEWYTPNNPVFSQERLDKINRWLNEDYILYIEDKPPYKIFKKRNEDKKTFHWQLWSIDEQYKLIKIIAERTKRKDLKEDIQKYLLSI